MRNIFFVQLAGVTSSIASAMLMASPAPAQVSVDESASADLDGRAVVVHEGAATATERLFVTLEAGLAIPLNDSLRDRNALGVQGGVGIFQSLSPKLALGLRPSYGVLTEDDDVQSGGYNFGILSAALRVRPFAPVKEPSRSSGFWLEAAGGPAIVEGHLRAAFTPGLGYSFPVGKLGLGPVARYLQVIEPDAPDARIAIVGIELTLFDKYDRAADGDRDGDGFRDARDACPDQAEVFNGINDNDGCPDTDQVRFNADRFVVDERIFFDFDQSVLLESGRARLKDLAELYKVENWQQLTVQGHTDSRGSEEYNEELSRARAQAVKAYLVASGIPEAKINVEAYGERRPLVPNADTPAEYQKNRRVEFVIKK